MNEPSIVIGSRWIAFAIIALVLARFTSPAFVEYTLLAVALYIVLVNAGPTVDLGRRFLAGLGASNRTTFRRPGGRYVL